MIWMEDNLIPKHRLKPQNDKRELKPHMDMPQQCLMQNPYWICKHDRNLVMVRMKILLCKCPSCGCKCKCRCKCLFMECLMQKSLLDMQTWMQLYDSANEDFLECKCPFMRMQMQMYVLVMQVSFMRMQMQMYVLVMYGFAPAWICRCKCNPMMVQMENSSFAKSCRKMHMRMLCMWCKCLNQYSWKFKNLLQHFCSKTGYLV